MDVPSRHLDWLRQAERDLEHARHALRDGEYEWACFSLLEDGNHFLASALEEGLVLFSREEQSA